MTPTPIDLDVAIVGGGPGGLATALAITRAVKGTRVKVFERAKKYRPLGAGVGMDVNGMKAIEAIDPALEKWFYDNGWTVPVAKTFDEIGNEVKSEKMDPSKSLSKYGKRGTILGWYEIQSAFYRALPPDTVVFDSRFESYEEDSEGVTVKFEGGEPGPVRAKVLIGADGYFSAVRQQCLDDGPPDFAGTVCWRARVNMKQPLEHSSWYFGAEKVGLLYPISKDHMVWTGSAPIRLVKEAGVDFDPSNGGRFRASTQAIEGVDNALERCLEVFAGLDTFLDIVGDVLLQRCLKVFAGYPETFLDIIRETDPRAVAEHGIFTRQAEALPADGWGRGRVTLVGDAAHPVRPTGQGLNMTMEDAAELAWHVQQSGLTPEALRSFELERIPRVGVIVKKAQQQGEAAYKKHAKDATRDNRSFATEEEYNDFKNKKEFRPLVPEQAASSCQEAAPISTEGLETAQKPEKEVAFAGLEKRPALVAGAALLGSIGLAALARVVARA
ncbi:FAD/NAD(P)-binding domain-containing protein [Coccomyxa subellipsoidea C-169]|uniref:FAD/NAD(P)-binding domain-containing protein n=1 Tax=Coccomyxa subellipsoidea (strain C-169) TaxID=574566 RepID=I0Z364_COCSC|nr:FAD/NAD(P)-binding domain-containing protein [Coccomyxa subellipsoidea C-169]EIE25083.1 FAD/NAD(P)-binding domain-containing protein [Coccomyxa subellipsoidea C-169]|eukprot:XP_005649627.1 FAD/NAD(P)-binding domain-containing protein [Coccomyxa subellipsoidea C-169]